MLRSSIVVILICALGVSGQEYQDGQYPSATPLFGITYSPFALNLDTMCLPVEQVQTDLLIIKDVADHIRTYNLATCPENMEVTSSCLPRLEGRCR